MIMGQFVVFTVLWQDPAHLETQKVNDPKKEAKTVPPAAQSN